MQGEQKLSYSYKKAKNVHYSGMFVHVFEQRIREKAKIDAMQFGFMPGKGTTDAIFTVQRMQEKYGCKGIKLYVAFVDLENAFARVPREVTRWAVRKARVEEWLQQQNEIAKHLM